MNKHGRMSMYRPLDFSFITLQYKEITRKSLLILDMKLYENAIFYWLNKNEKESTIFLRNIAISHPSATQGNHNLHMYSIL